MATGELRYGVDPYLEWVNREGVPVVEDIGIDLFEVPVKPWGRFGCDAPQFTREAEVISRACSSLRLPRVDPPRSSTSVREGYLCPRRARIHPSRIGKRIKTPVRMGPSQPIRDSSQRQVSSL